MADDRIALGLLTSLHEAALDGALWPAVMNQLALDFDAQAVHFYVEDWRHDLRAARRGAFEDRHWLLAGTHTQVSQS